MIRTCDHIIAPIAIVLMLGATACGKSQPSSAEHSDREPTDAVRWNLPKRLDEISGLASSSDGQDRGNPRPRLRAAHMQPVLSAERKGEFIVHVIFNCLKTLRFDSGNSADTDDLFVRSP